MPNLAKSVTVYCTKCNGLLTQSERFTEGVAPDARGASVNRSLLSPSQAKTVYHAKRNGLLKGPIISDSTMGSQGEMRFFY